MSLEAVWVIDGKPGGKPFEVEQGQEVSYSPPKACQLQLYVRGSKRGYQTETRQSNAISIE